MANDYDEAAGRFDAAAGIGGVVQPTSEFNLSLFPVPSQSRAGLVWMSLGGMGLDHPRVYAKTAKGTESFNERVQGKYLELARAHIKKTYAHAGILEPGGFLAGNFVASKTGGYAFVPLRDAQSKKLRVNEWPKDKNGAPLCNAVISYQPAFEADTGGLSFAEENA